jgi:hypothetical protein
MPGKWSPLVHYVGVQVLLGSVEGLEKSKMKEQ